MEKDKITPLGVDKKANPEQDSADYNKMKEPAQNAGPTKDAFANYVDFGDEFVQHVENECGAQNRQQNRSSSGETLR